MLDFCLTFWGRNSRAVSLLKFEPMVSNFPVIKASVAFITKATMGSLIWWSYEIRGFMIFRCREG